MLPLFRPCSRVLEATQSDIYARFAHAICVTELKKPDDAHRKVITTSFYAYACHIIRAIARTSHIQGRMESCCRPGAHECDGVVAGCKFGSALEPPGAGEMAGTKRWDEREDPVEWIYPQLPKKSA